MNFALDLDSTLLQLPVVERACADLGIEPALTMSSIRNWYFTDFDSKLRHRIYELFADTEFMCSLEPVNGAQYLVETILSKGHWIWIVTNRSEHMHDSTSAMILRMFPGTTPWPLCTTIPKASAYLRLKIDVVIDDSPANVAYAVMAGVANVYMYCDANTPYNRRFQAEFGISMQDLIEHAELDNWAAAEERE